MILDQVVEGHRSHRTGLTGTVEQVGVSSSTGVERGLLLPALRTDAMPIRLLPGQVVCDFFSVQLFSHLLIEGELCFLIRTK